MSAASNYLEAAVMAALFDGVPLATPTHTYLALHVGDSTETGANECVVGTWPAYARMCAEGVGAMGTGWTNAANGVRTNAKQMQSAGYDGVGTKTITHWSVWDAATGGNMITAGVLDTPRILLVGDPFAFDVGALTVTLA